MPITVNGGVIHVTRTCQECSAEEQVTIDLPEEKQDLLETCANITEDWGDEGQHPADLCPSCCAARERDNQLTE